MHNSKIENTKSFLIWGTGKPLREFLYAEDLADAISFVIENKISSNLLNIGSGKEISINDLTHLIQGIVGYKGELGYDTSKPDGNPRKLLDSAKIFDLGWKPKTELVTGLEKTYDWFAKTTLGFSQVGLINFWSINNFSLFAFSTSASTIIG